MKQLDKGCFVFDAPQIKYTITIVLFCSMIHFVKNSVLPAGFLIANIIGAGMFALPFVFQQSGLMPGVLYLGFFGILAALIHLIYADIILRTRETRQQFPGYIRQYLGKNAGMFAGLLVFTTLLFTLTAYLVLSASFLHILIPTLSPIIAMLFFWVLATVTIFITIKRTAVFDTVTAGITLAVIGVLFIYWGLVFPFDSDAFPVLTAKNVLVPFGPVLFSFIGFSAIPALVAYVRKESVPFSNMKKAIVVGSLTPALFYFLYVVAVWGMSPTVSPDSVSGLIGNAPFFILLALSILGFISLWDSYSGVGRDINKLLEYEWHITPPIALAITAGAPPALYMFGFQDFIALISAVGGILFSIWGILIIFAWKKAIKVSIPSVKFSEIYIPDRVYSIINDIPTFVIDLLVLVFVGGIIYELASLLTR